MGTQNGGTVGAGQTTELIKCIVERAALPGNTG